MIGPALYLWMLAQQPSQEPPKLSSFGWMLAIPEPVMTIPNAPNRWQMPAYFERRGDQRCVLLYTFSTDKDNYERIVMCTGADSIRSPRHAWTILECAGKGCEPDGKEP